MFCSTLSWRYARHAQQSHAHLVEPLSEPRNLRLARPALPSRTQRVHRDRRRNAPLLDSVHERLAEGESFGLDLIESISQLDLALISVVGTTPLGKNAGCALASGDGVRYRTVSQVVHP